MSQISRGILGGAAAAMTLCPIQFAFGSDLRGTVQDDNAVTVAVVSTVNRSAKGDRAAVATAPSETRKTLLFQVPGLSDTSVLMRMPVATVKVDAFKTVAAPVRPATISRKSAVACEPPVSVLTEVAKLLEPGRCVT